jgi:type IV secretion system protein TrbL
MSSPPPGPSSVIAFPNPLDAIPNPLEWLGDKTSEALADGWRGAMLALWSAGLWLLRFCFGIIDQFVVPDLSREGILSTVYPYTFGLGLLVVLVLSMVQIGHAVLTQNLDGIGKLLIGIAQFGAVWLGYIGVCAVLVTGSAGLTEGLLRSKVGVDSFSGYSDSATWPREVSDTTTATVLGLCTLVLLLPACIGYLMLMLVREAVLVVLVVTSPIAAAGLVAEFSSAWFWKMNRWFFAALFLAPVAALMLGIGVQIATGVVTGSGGGGSGGGGGSTSSPEAVGTAVVGCALILAGALCPVVLFRLLAFVDPGTGPGQAVRASMAAAGGIGGMAGKLTGSGGSGGSGAATESSGGRSGGEAAAETQTSSQITGAMGAMGAMGAPGSAATAAAGAVSAQGDAVLSGTGIGDPGDGAGTQAGDGSTGGQPPGPGGSGPEPAAPSPAPPDLGPGGGGGLDPGAGGGGGMPGGGGGAAAAAELPVVPV